MTRYGGGPVGLARARAATLTMLALPGSAYLYQGEESGLEQVDVAPEHRSDPFWLRTGPSVATAVGCRSRERRGPAVRLRTRRRSAVDPAADRVGRTSRWRSRRPTRTRPSRSTGPPWPSAAPSRTPGGDAVEMLDLGPDVVAFRRGPLTVALNCGTEPVAVPDGDVLMASGPVGATLPADTAVWLG